MRSRPTPSAEDTLVLTSTRQLLRLVEQQVGLAYADDTYFPAGDITIEGIARAAGGLLVRESISPRVQEIGVPGYCGRPVIVVNRDLSPAESRLAMRHGLAHLLAGELDAEEGGCIRFMASILNNATLEERRADLFALADLVPDSDLDALYLQGRGTREVQRYIGEQVRVFAPSWSLTRIQDRAHLRFCLYGDRRVDLRLTDTDWRK